MSDENDTKTVGKSKVTITDASDPAYYACLGDTKKNYKPPRIDLEMRRHKAEREKLANFDIKAERIKAEAYYAQCDNVVFTGDIEPGEPPEFPSNVLPFTGSLIEDDGFNPETDAQEWNHNLSGEIDYLIPFDCVARDIQEWILSSSLFPQPAIAYAAALTVISTVIGRDIALENIKGNIMFLCLAESGEGKDWPYKCVSTILDTLDMKDRTAYKMASGAALEERICAYPSTIWLIDEFGDYLNIISGRNSNQYSKEIVSVMTQLYTSADSSHTGKATKGCRPVYVNEPNLCVFGLATEGQVFDAVKTKDVANGSLARFNILFGINGQNPVKVAHSERKVPSHITASLNSLKARYCDKIRFKSLQLEVADDYLDYKYDLLVQTKEMSNAYLLEGGQKAQFAPFYNRSVVKIYKQAMLIDQCQSFAVIEWLRELEFQSGNLLEKKFNLLSSENETERQTKLLTGAIKKAGKKGITHSDLFNKTRQLTTQTRNQLLNECEQNGLIVKFNSPVKNSRQKSTMYFWRK